VEPLASITPQGSLRHVRADRVVQAVIEKDAQAVCELAH
jgi:hypothetical protein